METNHLFLTIKEAAALTNKSELTIRRLVKQHVMTSHVQSEDTPKGKAYQISKVFLQQHFQLSIPNSLPVISSTDLAQENAQLKAILSEKDQIIQQLQNRIFEQSDILNALTNQMTSQKVGHIEDLLMKQSEQLGELQKRLPESKPVRTSWFSRWIGKK
jgi:excisionase family DNA binding protein